MFKPLACQVDYSFTGQPPNMTCIIAIARKYLKLYRAFSGYPCSKCSRVFALQRDLVLHMNNSHSDTKQRLWQCDICPKNYRYKNGLQLHMLSHTGTCTVFVKSNPPFVFDFSVDPLHWGGQKLTWSDICMGVIIPPPSWVTRNN